MVVEVNTFANYIIVKLKMVVVGDTRILRFVQNIVSKMRNGKTERGLKLQGKMRYLKEAIDRIGSEVSEDYLEFIEEGYGGRAYHNELHAYMMSAAMAVKMKREDQEGYARFVIAAYFHDIVQIPTDDLKAVNLSITCLKDMLGAYLKKSDIDIISNMILASGTLTPKTEWEKRFLDADWSIIGASHWATYVSYSRRIEEETLAMGFHQEDFDRGRLHWLNNSLKKERIFFTEEFSSLEWWARTNLRKELDARISGTW